MVDRQWTRALFDIYIARKKGRKEKKEGRKKDPKKQKNKELASRSCHTEMQCFCIQFPWFSGTLSLKRRAMIGEEIKLP